MPLLPYHSPVAALLEVSDVAVHYQGSGPPVVAVDEATLDVEEGEAVGLLGESGCGKTTLLLAILGLLPPSATVVRGKVRFRGRDLLELTDRQRRRVLGAEIAVVLQDPALSLNPVRRIGPQVAEVVAAHRPWSRDRCREEALSALEEVGLAGELYEAYPHELSGGQRQRVAIAQALVGRPALLLADEPTAALDSIIQAEVRVLLRALSARRGLALLVVSHDLGALSTLAGRVYVMQSGRVVEGGPTARVFRDPDHPYTRGLLEAYPRPALARRVLHGG